MGTKRRALDNAAFVLTRDWEMVHVLADSAEGHWALTLSLWEQLSAQTHSGDGEKRTQRALRSGGRGGELESQEVLG